MFNIERHILTQYKTVFYKQCLSVNGVSSLGSSELAGERQEASRGGPSLRGAAEQRAVT